MADEFESLPPDDETPAVLLEDARDFLRDVITGWDASDGALDDAILAAASDEGATLYALLREQADDLFRDLGQTVFGIPAGDPVPATTETTWTARNAAPPGGYELPAGTTIAVSAPQGLVGFEVLEDHTLAEGQSVLADVPVVCLEDGTVGNGATGIVEMDDPLAWVLTITVDAPATGGDEGQDPAEHADAVARGIASLSRAPVLPRDFELLALESSDVARCLVRDLWDETTDLDDQERTVSLYPVGADGQPVSSPVKTEIEERAEARRELNWVVRVADPTYTTVDVEITVARTGATVDSSELETAVATAIAAGPLNPARFGLPLSGDALSDTSSSWQRRTVLRRYEIGAAADLVAGVDYVTEVLIDETGGTPVDDDLALTGSAPLVEAGDITVTVVDPV